jgi:hypothetical protein
MIGTLLRRGALDEQKLRDPATRRRIADGLERAIRRPGGRWALTAAVGVRRAALAEARPALEALIAGLRDPAPAHARGVAMALRLLTDGAGPLYAERPGEEGALEAAARAALAQLR